VGLFGGLGKLVGKGLKLGKGVLAKATPGGRILTTVSGVGQKIAKRIGRKNMKRLAIGGLAAIGAGGVATQFVGSGPGGQMTFEDVRGMGVGGRRRRRINPGNTRAMRRAIRRIESGARIYSKFFAIRHGRIRGAAGVRVKKLSIRRAA
jgi:hypothetical protein